MSPPETKRKRSNLVCPVCRKAPQAWGVEPNSLRCENASCRTVFPRIHPQIPALFDGTLDAVSERDPLDELEPAEKVVDAIRGLGIGSARANAIFVTTMYLRSHYLERPNFITALCDGLLGRIADPIATVLDLGCGVGGLAIEVAHRTGAHVVGVDSNPHALRWALIAAEHRPFSIPLRRSARSVEIVRLTPPVAAAPGSVEWVCANVGQPPLPAEAFDLVTAVNVLDSVDNPSLVLAQASALLRPGGHLLLAQPDAWISSGVDPEHWLADSPSEWDRVLAQVGLSTVACMDDIAWVLRQTDRVRFGYTLHARLAVREAWPVGVPTPVTAG